MKRSRTYIVLLLAALAAAWSLPPGMRAQSRSQAALVVRYGNNDVRTACVSFDEPQITGYELLQRSGAEIKLDVQGIGALVCSIDGTGCPANDCLCQCKGGGDCIYWSYWHRLQGRWQYSQGGASVYAVEHGAVEGWSWGPGAVNQAVAPPDLTFSDICQAQATDTPTPTATIAPPIVVNTPLPVATADNRQPETKTATLVIPTSTSTERPTATVEQIWTPTPFRQQATATDMPTTANTPAAIDKAAPAGLLSATPTPVSSEIGPAERAGEQQAVVEVGSQTVVENEALANETELMSTPAAVAAARRIIPERQEETPVPNAQKVAKPAAEATAPLQIIGAGIIPTISIDEEQQDLRGTEGTGIERAEIVPYLGFLVIVGGLVGLLGFVNLRRRRQN